MSASLQPGRIKRRTKTEKATKNTRAEDDLSSLAIDDSSLFASLALLFAALGSVAVLGRTETLCGENSGSRRSGRADDAGVRTQVRASVEGITGGADKAKVLQSY
jgi:hypothetical protein